MATKTISKPGEAEVKKLPLTPEDQTQPQPLPNPADRTSTAQPVAPANPVTPQPTPAPTTPVPAAAGTQPTGTGWVPLNSSDRYSSDEERDAAIAEQNRLIEQALAADPTLGTYLSQAEFDAIWSQMTPEQRAAVSPGSVVANQTGASGADEDLLRQEDYAIVQWAKDGYANATTDEERAYYHQIAERVRQAYGYYGGTDGSMYLIHRDGAGSGVTGGYGAGGGSPSGGGNSMQDLLEQWRQAALAQNSGAIDYEVQRAVTALERALADAQPQFKEQIEGVARDELQGLDNSALYAEARGDKGGIGQAQYNEIQAQAAENRLTVQQAQTKLSTDTARQIEDLRSQGEFEKADAALEIAQTYLSQLISIEQWAAEMQLSREQFQQSIRQWEAEYQLAMQRFMSDQELSYAQMTGKFSDGTSTLAASQWQQEQLASMGYALLESGIRPSAEQLAAMGMTEGQADEYLMAAQLESAVKGSDSGKGGGENKKIRGAEDVYRLLQEQGYNFWSNKAEIKAFLAGEGISNAAIYADGYLSWVKEQTITDASQLGKSAREMFTIISDGIYPSSANRKEIRYRVALEEITQAEADYLNSLL